ncbi:MAG TPA: prepilin peptidase [Candidatus Krumholzibacteria bacterium]|nr:prepilin peptidase [Candidatus Krumholzibacteria bacterium]HPD71463.1 prepilin peptidase [Candidatus Krumholzibacteria bacterium]HRY41604.1 prepilin peptidase [Candidatus Krumholzibacteria bacterium]
MSAAPIAAAGLVGLCLGSFANVLVHRLPREEGVVRGRSHCPHCRATIAWYDNLPVVSWIVLRARCRRCRAGIPIRYPLVELAGGLLAAGCLLAFGPTPAAAKAYVFLYLLGVIAIVDWQHLIIPHTLTVAGMVAGLALADRAGPGLRAALLGLAIGGGLVWALSSGYRLVRGQAGMGGGDVMLMAMVGTFLGPGAAAGVLGAGALLGTIYAIARAGGRPDGLGRLPFGTFLAAAAAVVLLWGSRIWTWYLDLLA